MVRINFRSLMPLCAALTLVGCSRSISIVKESDAPNGNFKIGQVLDHKANCSGSGWSQSKDENDRPVVEFKCDVRIPDGAFGKLRYQLHEDAKRQFDARSNGGPYITKGDGTEDPNPLSAYRLEESFSYALVRNDPDAAQQLDRAKAEYETIVQDLAKVDAACAASMNQRQAAYTSQLEKYFKDHAEVTEVIQFVLKDDEVVERNLSAHFADGSDALPDGAASWLYRAMLTANDPSTEYAVLTSRLVQRANVGDVKYCGNMEAYKPFAERVRAVSEQVSAATATFTANRQARGIY